MSLHGLESGGWNDEAIRKALMGEMSDDDWVALMGDVRDGDQDEFQFEINRREVPRILDGMAQTEAFGAVAPHERTISREASDRVSRLVAACLLGRLLRHIESGLTTGRVRVELKVVPEGYDLYAEDVPPLSVRVALRERGGVPSRWDNDASTERPS